jgi:predicted nucleic acid-binding protein
MVTDGGMPRTGLSALNKGRARARQRLRGRDEEDWPVLATALSLSCAIWTEDTDFFGTRVAVWTSDRVEIFLEEQSKLAELEEI